VDSAADQAGALAAGAGGYVGSDQRTVASGAGTATVSLRVPAAHFQSTVSALAGLGKQESRHVNTQDVTGQVIDVQSRLKTQQASVGPGTYAAGSGDQPWARSCRSRAS